MARRNVRLWVVAALVGVLLPVVSVAGPAEASTFAETTGGAANTWTNYTNAGGSQGPTIPAFATVQIACRLTGFRVANGNTWWYQIASSPWNFNYYVSADVFYNNGQTSGTLVGTPFVDPAVPICGSGGARSETTGGAANTWTNYTNAGGTQGPTIPAFTAVSITCKVTGFRVADGNTWWYQVASSPWNNAFYVSADAFYNNGQTSGSLLGTPFVDPAVPDCGSSGGGGGGGGVTTVGETTGGAAHTWSDYHSAGGTQGATIPAFTTVQISCKVTGFKVADGNTWWYLVATAPWSNQYYVSSDAFYNNGQTSGSLIGTPFVDSRVPDCSTGVRPSGETAGGLAHTWTNYTNAGGLAGPTVAAGQTIQVTCRVSGFAVANSNSWWYLISSAPWNNVYFVSADAFYNNGQTSGSLLGTPYVDTAVPVCGGIHVAPVPGTAYAVSSVATNHASCISGDPVNCASGNFFEAVTDIAIGGRGPGLNLTRTYNALEANIAGSFGNGWMSTVDQNLVVSTHDNSVTITLADGSQLVAVPTSGGDYSVPAYANSTLHHNADGTFTFRVHARSILTYSAAGVLQSISDLNGYRTTVNYSAGRLASITDSSGRKITFTLGADNLIRSAADPAGRTTTYEYNAAHDLISVTDPMGKTTALTYDGQHRMLTATNPRGGVVTNTYDGQGRILTQTDAVGLTNTYAYTDDNFSSIGGTTTITDPHGVVEVQRYQSGFLNQLIKAAGTSLAATWTYTYDQNTFGLTSVTDPNGHVSKFSYDAAGNRISATDATNQSTTTTYNSLSEPLTVTSPLSEVTKYRYDAAGNLLDVTDAGGHTTTISYGDSSHAGDVTAVTDADGRTSSYEYDSYGDVASHSVSPLTGVSNTTTFVSDLDGETVCVVAPNQNAAGIHCPAAGSPALTGTATQVIDADGRPTSITDPTGATNQFVYDANGNQIQSTDADSHVTTNSYDADDRLKTTTSAADSNSPSVTVNKYDLNPGDPNCPATASAVYCSASVDPNGGVTSSVYNALGDKIRQIRAGGKTTAYTYDAVGNLLTTVDPAGRTTSFTYDEANRRASVAYSDNSTHAVTYTYNADGRRVGMSDVTGTTVTTYDPAGRVTSVKNGDGVAVTYGYDGAGHVTTIGYPGGHTVSRSFDQSGELQSITDWLGHTSTFSYDADGNLADSALPNGDHIAQTYDLADQLMSTTTSAAVGTLAKIAYTRDAAGLIVHEATSGALSGSVSYSYDSRGQLLSAGSTSYGYDPNGNMTSAGTGTLSYNTSNELTTATTGTGVSTSYLYDAVGDRTSTSPTSGFSYAYAYDQNGRMTSATATPGDPPTVTGLSRSTGTTSGAQAITITGTHLTDATAVSFGGADASTFTVVSDTKITATTPAHSPGPIDVTVTTPSGSSASTSADEFTYVPPVPAVAGLAPASGSSTGHATVTISGTGFSYASAVSFGTAAALDYTVVSDTKITATSPPGALGSVDVRVATASGSSGLVTADRYTYVKPPLPVVTSFSPQSGTTGGGTAVTVNGTGFWGATKVAFGTPAGTHVTVLSDTKLTVTSPAHAAGSANVKVTTPGGTSAISAATVYKYVLPPKPVVANVTPASGTTGGGTSVTISGSNFEQASKVVMGGTAITALTLVSSTAITVSTPAHAAGTVNVQVVTPGGTSATNSGDVFTFVAPPKPTVTGISPATGSTAGGTSVTITGANLTGATKVTIGGTLAKTFNVVSPTTIAAVTPAHVSGSVHTIVTTPAGVSVKTTADTFVYSTTATSSPSRSSGSRLATSTTADASTASTTAATVTTYVYNGDGLRTSQTGSTTTNFTWDTLAPTPRIIFDGSTFFIYGPNGLPLEQIRGSATNYFVTDAVGSTRALIAEDGSVGATFNYDAYGGRQKTTGNLRTPLMYAQSYSDPGSGLQYLVNRSYDAQSGQFTTVDPLVTTTGMPYRYAASDPVNQSDPAGLWSPPKYLGYVPFIGDFIGAYQSGEAIANFCDPLLYYNNSKCQNALLHTLGVVGSAAIPESKLKGAGKVAQELVVHTMANVVNDNILSLDAPHAGETWQPASGASKSSVVCISLMQSSYSAASHLQNAAPATFFQSASARPVQQSSNSAATHLQAAAAFTGSNYIGGGNIIVGH